ncbi:MAG: hypothetical protein AMJ69_08070 [Gammaproteobacteria bacterium SG8_47]|nr:MAG: hypothetical protein AMJ69_08070 [Gammaproteobacteria bacterium SG8_47]
MSIFRVLKWIAITFVGVVTAVILYLSFADLNWLKPRIESAVAEATGRQLKLGGTFDLDIVPSPSIVLEDVSFSNAEWGSEPALANIGHFSARIGFWSLLSGPLRVKQLSLRDVDVLLETNQQGEANWVVGPAPAPAPEEEAGDEAGDRAGSPVIVELAEIRAIRMVYKAPQAKDFLATLAAFDISSDDAEYMVLNGKGKVRDLPLQLSGKLGPAPALASGTGINVDLNAGLDNVALEVDGTIGDLATASGIDLKAVATSDDVAQILRVFAVELPLAGALRIETALTSVEDGLRLAVDATAGEIAAAVTATHSDRMVEFKAAVPALDKVGAALAVDGLPAQDLAVDGRLIIGPDAYRLRGLVARLGEAEVRLDGTISKDTDVAELTIRAGGPSLAALSPGLPPLPFKAALTASLAPERLVLDAVETTFGASDLRGAVEIAMGEKTAITGQLKSNQLDLTPFAATNEEGAKDEQPTSETEVDETTGKYVFVDEPLPFDELNKTDIDIKADIARLALHDTLLIDTFTALTLKDGTLKFNNRFAGPHGGRSISNIALTAAGETAQLDINVNMRDLRLNLMSGEVADPSLIPPVGITLDLAASGGSPRSLASSANGRVLATQGKGKIRNELAGKVSGDILAELFSALNPFAKQEEFTTLDCTIISLDISNGKAKIPGLFSQGKKIQIVGGGDIDLNTEALNIEFNTKPRQGIGVSADMFITPFVKLSGTLANPGIGLDKKGTLLAVATGGLSVLIEGAADRATAAKDRCVEVLAKVGDHPPLDN